MAFAALPGVNLYYEVHGPAIGEAPVIVFAHGAGGNHMSWWQQVPHFSGRFTCVTFDHRGWGQSVDDSGEGALRFADDLLGLLDMLGVDRFALAAQSMGGWTSLRVALRHPERVTHLVMSDTHGGTRGPEIPSWTGGPPPDRESGYHPAAGETMRHEQPALNFLYWQVTSLNPESVAEARKMLRDERVQLSTDDLRKLSVPTLFIAGAEDIVIPPNVVEAAASLVDGARFVTFPKSGHSVHFERAPMWNGLVEDFVSS
jgi:3-oxoadipate enol-lactonase